ncbi:hypothetical protein LIER_37414 [Lithospermum erythrorhizon]|uniref:RING-type E3 ubiquitin transferase n=1 Tax=Lithospermum erythrorhizon TaxID=34254 RepID=A0AAV3PP33_LITER
MFFPSPPMSPMLAPPSPGFTGDITQQKLVAVAIDKDRGSQATLKWTIDTVCQRGQILVLIHVKLRPSGSRLPPPPRPSMADGIKFNGRDDLDQQTKDLFLPYRVFCTRKDIHCLEVVLEDTDVAKALVEYVKQSGIDVLSIGAGPKNSFFRFLVKDIPGAVLKGIPEFCSVYVISKGKISNTRAASRPAPHISPLRSQIMNHCSSTSNVSNSSTVSNKSSRGASRETKGSSRHRHTNSGTIRSPFNNRRGPNGRPYDLSTPPESDISYVSSGKQSMDNALHSFTDDTEDGRTPPNISGFNDHDMRSFESFNIGRRSGETSTPPPELATYASRDNSFTNQNNNTEDDVEAEMQRLKKELKQTMEMYSTACKEALSAQQQALELQRWKMEEQRKLEETRSSEESAVAQAEKEKAKSRVAYEHTVAARRIAEIESQKRLEAEKKVLKEAEERNKGPNRMTYSDCRYRRYTIEEIEFATEYFSQPRKIGEGGYGPVYKCYLDHTPAAVKVLRPDAAQGRSQFQQEVEVLSCIRHPNMVLLLGACPEYGCLVYEYMSNGSLEDRLLQKGKTPPLSWQHRFRIAAEITRGLLFLHQTKPEPIVHRDLKPGNILLDRNLVSKISDVGLARLVPPSVADNVTQYRMTSTAGTFCYIDPEYQQTGMLGVKSDVYSLGIIFLQILTAKPAMGLTHYVERAIEGGTFAEMLDPSVHDWPVEDALCLANLALQCAELRRKDRPDLAKVVMPELERLRELSEESSSLFPFSGGSSAHRSQVSLSGEDFEYPSSGFSGYEGSRSRP